MNKKTLIILAVIVPILIIAVGYAIWNITNSDHNAPSFVGGVPITDDGSDEMAVSAVIGQGMITIATKTGTTTVPTKSYGDALGIYGKSGYRFQFLNCSGNPGSLTMKLGTKFMIDNRDNASHQIGIGTKTYKLAAYDFAIVSIQKIGNFNITCDGGGSANVWIQK